MIHRFECQQNTKVSLPVGEGYRIKMAYEELDHQIRLDNGSLTLEFEQDFEAVAVYLTKGAVCWPNVIVMYRHRRS